jgi:hypothetical protein
MNAKNNLLWLLLILLVVAISLVAYFGIESHKDSINAIQTVSDTIVHFGKMDRPRHHFRGASQNNGSELLNVTPSRAVFINKLGNNYFVVVNGDLNHPLNFNANDGVQQCGDDPITEIQVYLNSVAQGNLLADYPLLPDGYWDDEQIGSGPNGNPKIFAAWNPGAQGPQVIVISDANINIPHLRH